MSEPTNLDLLLKIEHIAGMLEVLTARIPEPPVQLMFCGLPTCPGTEPGARCSQCQANLTAVPA